jgi:hypothetical protein
MGREVKKASPFAKKIYGLKLMLIECENTARPLDV